MSFQCIKKDKGQRKTSNTIWRCPHSIQVAEDPYEGGYVISFPDLVGCLTCVDKFEDIVPMAEDAKRSWMEAVLEMGQKNSRTLLSGKVLRPLCLKNFKASQPFFGETRQKGRHESQSILFLSFGHCRRALPTHLGKYAQRKRKHLRRKVQAKNGLICFCE